MTAEAALGPRQVRIAKDHTTPTKFYKLSLHEEYVSPILRT